MDTLGERLKELREMKGFTLEYVATRIGTTKTSIARYEKNDREPKSEMLTTLADFYNVSTDYLLGRTNVRRFEDFPPEVKSIVELFASVGPSKAKKIEELLREVLEK